LRRLQIGENPLYSSRARLSPLAQIENKPRIADSIPAESGWCDLLVA